MVLGEEVELYEVPNLCDHVLGLKVKTTIGSGASGEDALDDTSRFDIAWSGGREAQESSDSNSEGSVCNHVDYLMGS